MWQTLHGVAVFAMLALKLLLLGALAGTLAGVALGAALFRQRDPRRAESLARKLVLPYGLATGIAFGVIVALFAVPHSAGARGWWLIVCVASSSLSAVFAGGFAFDYNARRLMPGRTRRVAAREAAEDLLRTARGPARWMRTKPSLHRLCARFAEAAKTLGKRVRDIATNMRPPGTPKD